MVVFGLTRAAPVMWLAIQNANRPELYSPVRTVAQHAELMRFARSPAYNLARTAVLAAVGLLLASNILK